MKKSFFTSVIVLFSLNSAIASDYCRVDTKKSINQEYNKREAEELFKELSKNNECILEEMYLGGFYSRKIKRIQFRQITEWRGGISGTYLFQCSHTVKYGPSTEKNMGYSCLQLTQ